MKPICSWVKCSVTGIKGTTWPSLGWGHAPFCQLSRPILLTICFCSFFSKNNVDRHEDKNVRCRWSTLLKKTTILMTSRLCGERLRDQRPWTSENGHLFTKQRTKLNLYLFWQMIKIVFKILFKPYKEILTREKPSILFVHKNTERWNGLRTFLTSGFYKIWCKNVKIAYLNWQNDTLPRKNRNLPYSMRMNWTIFLTADRLWTTKYFWKNSHWCW